MKIGVGAVSLLLVAWATAAAFSPSLTDPKNNLAKIAKKVAAGPNSPTEAKDIKNEFDEAVKDFLKHNGSQPSSQLCKNLQQALSEAAFEVHVFDLPRGLSVVEIDTVLQASDYLVLKNGTSLKVFSIPGLEVFDSAQIIADGAAPVLVILGHTGGQSAHKPLIKVMALLPDDVVDQTTKSVPDLKYDGSASFTRNGRDINLVLSTMSLGVSKHLFAATATKPAGLPDETVKSTLKWQNGHYDQSVDQLGSGQLSILYAVAKIVSGAKPEPSEKNLVQKVFKSSLASHGSGPQEFSISSASNKQSTALPKGKRANSFASTASYILQGKNLNYIVTLARSGQSDSWSLLDAKQSSRDLDSIKSSSISVQNKAPEDKIITASAQSTSSVKQDNTERLLDRNNSILKATELNTESVSKKSDKKPEEKLPIVTAKADGLNNKKTNSEKTATATANPPNSKEQNAVGIDASVSDKIEVSQIRMRSGPGAAYKQVSTLARGAKIKVIGKTSGWYKVRVNGQDGYVYGGFVDYKTPDAYDTLTVQKPGRLTDDRANIVGETKPGERLVVLGGSNGRIRVQLSSGKTAYISKDAVDQKDDTPQFVP
jgi:SH3-like domain-containing protein